MRHSKRISAKIFVIALSSLVLPGSAFVMAKSAVKNEKFAPPEITVPDVDTKPAEQAQADAVAARADRKKAEDNLASVVARLKDEFEKSPAMVQAQADLKAAQAAFDTSATPVIDRVHETSEYKAAVNAKFAAEAKLTELHDSPGNDVQIAESAQEAMKQRVAATKLENDALAQDDAALQAKKKTAAAVVAVGKLHAQFIKSLPESADWKAARKSVDDAIQKLEAAEATSRQESTKLAAAEAAHNAAQARKDTQERNYRQAAKPQSTEKPTQNN